MVTVPPLRGVIDRRVLVNFRIDATVLASVLPDPFEPRTVDGYAIGGICLLRLTDVRPRGLPSQIGVRSENAAHRIGVRVEQDGEMRDGVFVPRRDTSSRVTACIGDQSFGNHHHAAFSVSERGDRYEIAVESSDGEMSMHVDAERTDEFPATSVFDSLDAASDYHRRGARGYSPAPDGKRFEGIEIEMFDWSVSPLDVTSVTASYFESDQFPNDAVTFDNALLMESIDHEWHSVDGICPSTSA